MLEYFMTNINDQVWKLLCKNEKCEGFFDYFGRLDSYRTISCTHCGKSSKFHFADFVSQATAK